MTGKKDWIKGTAEELLGLEPGSLGEAIVPDRTREEVQDRIREIVDRVVSEEAGLRGIAQYELKELEKESFNLGVTEGCQGGSHDE